MKLWIDTDAGVDDATAILLALHAPDIEVVGISCVGGNASLENVIKNVNRTTTVYGKGAEKIPIYAGCSKALIQPPMVIPEIHGHDGLGDIDDIEFGTNVPIRLEKEHGVSALLAAAEKYDDLCLLALGPLTNIAVATRMSEKTVHRIKHMYIMGGAEDGIGNTSPVAEFNFRCDPEAAHIVFESVDQKKITLISWTLTLASQITPENNHEIVGFTNTVLERFVTKTWAAILAFTKGFLWMADPLAAFVACNDPSGIIEEERLKISIVLHGDDAGKSNVTPCESGTRVVKKIDMQKYKKDLRDMMTDH